MTPLPEHATPSPIEKHGTARNLRNAADEGDAFESIRLDRMIETLERILGYLPTPTGPRLVNVPGQGQTHAGMKR